MATAAPTTAKSATGPVTMAPPSIIVLLGPPGAGKGTQGEQLATVLGIPKLATGDLLRAAVREGTALGREAKAFMDRGDLVPDAVILGIMKQVLADPSAARGAILDGVVRTVPQAEGLRTALGELGRAVSVVLLFDIDEEELARRLGARTVCGSCQTPYSGLPAGSVCPKCGGTLVRRKDDEPVAVRQRMAVYRAQTAPVISWYEKQGVRVVPIDAVGSPEEVRARVLRVFSR